MGQIPLFKTCPECGKKWGLQCYGVIRAQDGHVSRRYFRCQKCGTRIVREYLERWRHVRPMQDKKDISDERKC